MAPGYLLARPHKLFDAFEIGLNILNWADCVEDVSGFTGCASSCDGIELRCYEPEADGLDREELL